MAYYADDAVVGVVINYGDDAITALENGISPSLIKQLDELGKTPNQFIELKIFNGDTVRKFIDDAIKGGSSTKFTQEGLDNIIKHLTTNVDGMSYEPNKLMLDKIKYMISKGEELTGAFKNFYEHELAVPISVEA